jgi:hypothetical protein
MEILEDHLNLLRRLHFLLSLTEVNIVLLSIIEVNAIIDGILPFIATC